MNKILFLFFFLLLAGISPGQTPRDTTGETKTEIAGDDPSQFFTRIEFFNELQHFKNKSSDYYLNQTTFRTIVKIGTRFTTRLDIPFLYNSFSSKADYQQFGLSDISFRLLGYKFLESRKSAITASIEVSLNTSNSPLVGTGKNIILPVVSYTATIKANKLLLAFILQEGTSVSGDKTRDDISYTKIQAVLIKIWSRKMWTLFAPECYVDYIHGGVSMNLEGRIAYAPVRRINFWGQAGAGLFGDFIARYQWGAEAGCRYFLLRNTIIKRKNKK